MTNLELWKKEAREKLHEGINWRAVFGSGGTAEREVAEFLDTLIDHIHAATIEECIGVMPEKYLEASFNSHNLHLKQVRNAVIDDAIARLQAMITEPV